MQPGDQTRGRIGRQLFAAVKKGVVDVVATDHAPHTASEKSGNYLEAPSGLPLVQHSLVLLLRLCQQGELTPEEVVQRACHAPAQCFGISDRGFLDEGMWADIVVVDPEKRWTVHADQLLYKCGWSPIEGMELQGAVDLTFVNGTVCLEGGEDPGKSFSHAIAV